ncbi:MAG TPA: hypothetical protein VHC69_23130 [Polyangiaceae bacterium]|nr:hypothetical protein [Polyangiaceae bacterium]
MTSRARPSLGLFLGIAAGVAFAACSTSGPPLGGPHGGNGTSVGPTVTNESPVDAAYTVRPPDAAPGGIAGAPNTWLHIYTSWLAVDTIGNCSKTGANCHAQDMSNATAAYQWLEQQGYVGGGVTALVDPNFSCLSWFGGDMPPTAPDKTQSDKAAMEMMMWAMAGGTDNL